MKIAHIIGGIDFRGGGPAYFVITLNAQLNELGIDSVILTTNAGYNKNLKVPLHKLINHHGGKVIFSSYSNSSTLRNLPYIYYSGLLSTQFYQYLYRNLRDYDIIHIYGFFSIYTIGAALMAIHFNKPYILSPRGSLMTKGLNFRSQLPKKIFLKSIGCWLLKNSSVIHVSSNLEKNALINLGIAENRICVIPNCINLSDFKTPQQKESIFLKLPHLKGKKIILFLSRISKIKGLDILIPALSKVIKVIPDVHLILAGPDNEGYLKEVKCYILKYNLEKYITYIGSVRGSEKFILFRDCDVFVLPSYSESFGISAIEAMYMRRPIIVTKAVGISDVIRSYNCGIVIDADCTELSGALIKILENGEIAKQMGEMGRKCVEENYLPESVTAKMLAVYNKILRG